MRSITAVYSRVDPRGQPMGGMGCALAYLPHLDVGRALAYLSPLECVLLDPRSQLWAAPWPAYLSPCMSIA